MPLPSWITAWKMRSPDRVGMVPLVRTWPTTVASIPTASPPIGVTVEASS